MHRFVVVLFVVYYGACFSGYVLVRDCHSGMFKRESLASLILWDVSMKNEECVIYIVTRTGGVLQSYHKTKDGWIQTSRNGAVRHCTAEQLLSHILPPLAGISPAQVKVEKI